MIERIIGWSARNGFLVGLLVLFLMGWGIWVVARTPLDALPDLSDVQVIVFTEWPGRSPDLVEDQITYPIVTSMLGAPQIKYVRGAIFSRSLLCLHRVSRWDRHVLGEKPCR